MKEIFSLLLVLCTIVILVVIMVSTLNQNGQKRCEERFGPNWSYRGGTYSPDICIDKEGAVKYL